MVGGEGVGVGGGQGEAQEIRRGEVVAHTQAHLVGQSLQRQRLLLFLGRPLVKALAVAVLPLSQFTNK